MIFSDFFFAHKVRTTRLARVIIYIYFCFLLRSQRSFWIPISCSKDVQKISWIYLNLKQNLKNGNCLILRFLKKESSRGYKTGEINHDFAIETTKLNWRVMWTFRFLLQKDMMYKYMHCAMKNYGNISGSFKSINLIYSFNRRIMIYFPSFVPTGAVIFEKSNSHFWGFVLSSYRSRIFSGHP